MLLCSWDSSRLESLIRRHLFSVVELLIDIRFDESFYSYLRSQRDISRPLKVVFYTDGCLYLGPRVYAFQACRATQFEIFVSWTVEHLVCTNKYPNCSLSLNFGSFNPTLIIRSIYLLQWHVHCQVNLATHCHEVSIHAPHFHILLFDS